MGNRNLHTQEIRETNSENLADIRNGAKASFLEMIDSLISSHEDNIKVTLKESDKSKVRTYYIRWFRELDDTVKWVIYAFIFFNIAMFVMMKPELGFIKEYTDNEVIYSGLPYLLMFVIATFILAALTTEKSIERFFFHLYPHMSSIAHKEKVAIELLDFLFTEREQKEHDFKAFVYLFIAMFIFMFFATTLKVFVGGVVVSWIAIVLFHEKRNNVFWKKG